MKLKPIPTNTVVHTPTKAEAKELLTILHENGYRGADGAILNSDKYARANKCYYIFAKEKGIAVENSPSYNFAEFKERYVEEKKPQPKFYLGERIRIASSGEEDFINMITKDDCYKLLEHRGKYTESDLIPYTEPETKSTEDMETKEEKSEIPINLCELLRGHEGETFYHLMYGEVEYKGVNKDGFIAFTDSKIPTIYDDGKYDQHANVVLYPSRALYEQYPLDSYTAWMKWQEEQERYFLSLSIAGNDLGGRIISARFRSPTDRNKAIEEIKAVIVKYAK